MPIGVIARSAPILNIPMPSISNAALMEKTINSMPEKLNQGNREIAYTINVIGNADSSASLILEKNTFIGIHLSLIIYSITEKPGDSKCKTEDLHFFAVSFTLRRLPLILFRFCFVLSICTVVCIDISLLWSTILEKSIHMLPAIFRRRQSCLFLKQTAEV